jgi:transcriptional regulator with XRE-family HTH domain
MQVNGARIRELRRARGMTIEQLAVRVGIGYETLATIERGARSMPLRLTLAAIADGLGVTVEDITITPDEPAEASA